MPIDRTDASIIPKGYGRILRPALSAQKEQKCAHPLMGRKLTRRGMSDRISGSITGLAGKNKLTGGDFGAHCRKNHHINRRRQ